MATVDDVVVLFKDLSLEDIEKVENQVAAIKKNKALKELDEAEAKVNQLRRAAGMKARPPGKKISKK